MTGQNLIPALVLAALVAACDSRAVDQVDAEAGTWDQAAADSSAPRDRNMRDACLPIAAKQVKGSYSGTWKGKWVCPGLSAENVSGKLSFSLSPAGSPEQYKVAGSMSGSVVPVMTFQGSISGTMGCTALQASLPDIKVSSGAIIYELRGAMQATYRYTPASARGFPNGTWTAKEKSGPCSASGTWIALYQ